MALPSSLSCAHSLSLSLSLCFLLYSFSFRFNHMVASGNDAASGTGPAAVAMETMYQYTAYFNDNDPREAAATVVVQNPDHTNSTVHIGAPMP